MARSACCAGSICSPWRRSTPWSKIPASRSREFRRISSTLSLYAAYPVAPVRANQADRWSTLGAGISRETQAWLAHFNLGRFAFTFTPSTAPGLNSSRAFSPSFARSVLRHIRWRQSRSSRNASCSHQGRQSLPGRPYLVLCNNSPRLT